MDKINSSIQERTIGLIGEENLKKFKGKTIAILGLGGVGGTAFQALARSGFMHFFLVDCDRVEYSNLNRQVLFTSDDVGLRKVDCALSFLGSLTDGVVATCAHDRVTKDNVEELLGKTKIDFIVDAIDDIDGKLALIKYANEKNIPLLVSGGMGNRLNPTKIEIISLEKTTNDPLAKKLRIACRKEGIDTKKVMTVHSTELPVIVSKTPQSMIMVPSAAGLFICYYVVNYFINKGE